MTKNKNLIFIIVICLTTSILYLLTLSPSANYGDSSEFIAASKTLGIAHPPGYPLYIFLSHLFTLLPLQNVALKVNLFSALTSVLTIVVIYSSLVLITKKPIAALVSSLLLAFTYQFWLYSIVAEVYSLESLLLSLVLFLSFLVVNNPQEKRYYYSLAFITTIAFIGHYTLVFMIPAFFLLIFFVRKHIFNREVIGYSIFFFLMGLLPLIYLPLRAHAHPALNWGSPETLENFFNLILRKDYGVVTLTTGSNRFNIDILMFFLSQFITNVWGIWTIIGIIGLFWGIKNYRNISLFLITSFLLMGPLFIPLTGAPTSNVFSRASVESFSLPPYVIWLIFCGFGITGLLHILSRWRAQVSMVVLLLPLLSVFQNYTKVDQSKNYVYEQYGKYVFESLPPHAVVLTFTDKISMIAKYLQLAKDERPDIIFISFTFLPDKWYAENLQYRYPELAFPYDKFVTKRLSEQEAANIICEDVAPKYPTFVERQSAGFNTQATPNCSYHPYGLLVKVENPAKKISTEELKNEGIFWSKIMDSLVKEKPYDLYTRSVMYNYAESLTNLGLVYSNIGEGDNALKLFYGASQLSSDYPDAFYYASEYERQKDNIDKAIQLNEQAIAADSTYYKSYKLLGILYVKNKNDSKKSLYYFQKYMRTAPEGKEKAEVLKLINLIK